MERRVFLTGIMGVAGAAVIATALPRQANALAVGPLADTTPDEPGTVLDQLKGAEEVSGPEGVDVAWHRGHPHGGYHRRRRRIRRRRWRRACRRYRNRWGHWTNRCRRVPFWAWIWI